MTTMNVGAVCRRQVISVRHETSVTEAARLMRRHHIGDVVVLAKGSPEPIPVGIVTDRDIVVEVIACQLDPGTLTVGDLLVGELTAVDEDESCADTVRLMSLHGVRRMPVVDAQGRLVGIVSLDDLLPYFSQPLARLSHLATRARSRERRTRN